MSGFQEHIDDHDELLRRINDQYIVVEAWTTSRSSYARCLVFDLHFQIPISFAEFRKRYANVRFESGDSIANWWRKHPDRRQVHVREDLPGV